MDLDNEKYLKLIRRCNKLLDKQDRIEEIIEDIYKMRTKQQIQLVPFYIQQEQKPNEIIYKLDSQNRELIKILEELTEKFKDSIKRLPTKLDIKKTEDIIEYLNKL